LFLSFSLKAKHHDTNYQPAIVFIQKVSIKAEPIINTSEVFQLHEGTKVFIIEQIKDWSKIKLIDGKMGWILDKHIKKIKS
jgi:SH3-like domain-containing protein